MAGMECMEGSAMYFITTGMPNSHTRMDLSSEEVMNRRFSSQKVMVFTAPRCWSYSCVTSPASKSHCTTFLSENPACRPIASRRSECVVQYMRGTSVQNASYQCCQHVAEGVRRGCERVEKGVRRG
eukprot:1043462-Prorocentrum_minimum.AAC.1